MLTADFVTSDNLHKIVMRMVEKTMKKEEQTKKRYYSDYIEDKMLDCYTISKQYAEKDE
jgi:predicted kinase